MEGAKNFKYAIGKESLFGVKAAATARLALLSTPSIAREQNHAKASALWGALTEPKDAAAVSTYSMAFAFDMPGIPALLPALLECALGAVNGNDYVLANTLPSFTLYKASSVRDEVVSGCKVKELTFGSGDTAQMLRFAVRGIGSVQGFETAGSNAIPDFPAALTPLIHKGCAFQLGGAEFPVNSASYTLAWGFDESDFRAAVSRNSLGEESLSAGGRLECNWDATAFDMFQAKLESGATAALTHQWTGGGKILTVTCPNVCIVSIQPRDERGRARLLVGFECFDTAAGAKDAIKLTLAQT